MNTITLHAPAKINLTLAVTGKRPDGYHTLLSVMQTVNLCDRITVTRTQTPGVDLWLSDPTLPTNGRNTAYRAAEMFLRETNRSFGVRIEVEKHIPQQAGMAGGSADAAGVLCALNALANTPCTVEDLCRMGAAIGADVPFCVRGGCALAEGIGEIMTPLPLLPACTIVAVKPPVGVSTAEAYRLVDERFSGDYPDVRPMIEALRARNLPGVGQALYNVFETAVHLSEVAAIQSALAAFSPAGSVMTGSGSTVVAIFEQEHAAASCAAALAAQGEVHVCHPCASGPWVAAGDET